MSRQLKVYNGDGFFKGRQVKLHACAHSIADVVRVAAEHDIRLTPGYIREFWSDCWGTSMDDVERERGIWVGRDPPVKLTHG